MSKVKSKSKPKPVAKNAKPLKKVITAKKGKALANTPKAAAKKVVAKAKPVVKKIAPKAKPVAKKIVKKVVAKAKPVAKKVIVKAKPVIKKVAPKAKPVAKKAKAKVVVKAKPVAKAPAKAKAVAKRAAKPIAKAVAKPVAKVVAKPIAKPIAKAIAKLVIAPKAAAKLKIKPEPVKEVKPSMEISQKNELPKLSTIQTTHSFTKQKVQPAPSKAKELNADGTDKLRYSDKELQEFKTLITDKIANAKAEFILLQQQISNANDHGTDDTGGTFKMLEDGSETLAKEEAAQLATRQRKFIEQLESALIRIDNKTYGICRVTGKLIPKERLKAVPHTTQSIEAKLLQHKD